MLSRFIIWATPKTPKDLTEPLNRFCIVIGTFSIT